MKSPAAKVAFALLWLILFYELLFDPSIKQPLSLFCTDHPLLAPLVLVATQLVLASFALPCSPVTLLAGVLWGFGNGILYSTVATVLASMWTFYLGRTIVKRHFSEKQPLRWWESIMGLVIRYKWKASMVAHINPLFPGSSLGYVFGMSDLGFGPFVLGVIVGTLPLQILMVSTGRLMFLVSENLGDLTLIVPMLTLAVVTLAYRIFVPRLMQNDAPS